MIFPDFRWPRSHEILFKRGFEKEFDGVGWIWAPGKNFIRICFNPRPMEILYVFRVIKVRPRPTAKVLCLNHRAHLVEVNAKDVVTCYEPEAVKGVSTMATFIRTGSYYIRMVVTIVPILTEVVDFEVGQAPAWAHDFALELKDFAVSQRKLYRNAYSNKTRKKKKRRGQARTAQNTASSQRDYETWWDTHLQLWTGPFEQRGEKIIVFVPAALSQEEKAAYIRRMGKSFVKTSLSSQIVLPQDGKWTTFTPPLEWLNQVANTNGMLDKMMQQGGRNLEMQLKKAKPVLTEARDEDGVQQKVLWHEFVGARLQRGKELSASKSVRVAWTMSALLLELVKPITSFFLKASSEKVNSCTIRTLDFLNPSFSVLDEALQELRLLASGTSRRARLLFGSLGYRTMLDLMASDSDSSAGSFLCTYARITSASLYRRCGLMR